MVGFRHWTNLRVLLGAGALILLLALALLAASDCGSSPVEFDSVFRNAYLPPKWTADGSRILLSHQGDLVLVSADGKDAKKLTEERRGFNFELSPDIALDGSRIVYTTWRESTFFSRGTEGWRIETSDVGGRARRVLTEGNYEEVNPAWSPDGSRVAFVSGVRSGLGHRVYTMTPDGSDVQALVPAAPARTDPPAWSADGEYISFLGTAKLMLPGTHSSFEHTVVYIAKSDGNGFTMLGQALSRPQWSPKENRIAFVAPEGDSRIIYTSTPDGTDLKAVYKLTITDSKP